MQTAAVLVAAVLFEVAVAAMVPDRGPMIAAAVIGAAGFAVALAEPRWALVPIFATLAFIPVYAAPKVGPLYLEATVCGLWLLVAALALRILVQEALPPLSLLDVAVAVFFVVLAGAVVFGGEQNATYIQRVFLWFGPYLALRLFVHRDPDVPFLSRLVVGIALAIVPLVLLEVATGLNPFSNLVLNSGSDVWGETQERLGSRRAEGAFGHSIALGMFLATAALLALGMGAHTQDRRARGLWLGSTAVLLLALGATLSRTGWVMFGVGMVLLVLTARPAGRARLGVMIAVAAVLTFGASQVLPSEVPTPLSLAAGDQEISSSGNYRVRLLELALEPGALKVIGPADRALAAPIGGESLDNAFLSLAQDFGVLPAVAFFLVVLAVIWSVFRLRRQGLEALLPVVTVTNLVGLLFVALITQQQVLIWALIGATAALVANAGRSGGGRADARGDLHRSADPA